MTVNKDTTDSRMNANAFRALLRSKSRFELRQLRSKDGLKPRVRGVLDEILAEKDPEFAAQRKRDREHVLKQDTSRKRDMYALICGFCSLVLSAGLLLYVFQYDADAGYQKKSELKQHDQWVNSWLEAQETGDWSRVGMLRYSRITSISKSTYRLLRNAGYAFGVVALLCLGWSVTHREEQDTTRVITGFDDGDAARRPDKTQWREGW